MSFLVYVGFVYSWMPTLDFTIKLWICLDLRQMASCHLYMKDLSLTINIEY